jgi:hypothetical protein
MEKSEINKIALKYKCWIDSSDKIFYLGENGEKPKYLGKVYWKSKTGYFHATNISEYKYEGQKKLNILLENFLKGEGII